MRKPMRRSLGGAAGIALVLSLGLVAGGQLSTRYHSFDAQLPLIIGDVVDPFRYAGEEVRALAGSASFNGDPVSNTGLLLAVVRTTEESGPIVVSESMALQGVIRIEMEQFLGTESYMSGGLAEDLSAHGDTGVMSNLMPELRAELAGWGLLDVYVNGVLVFDDLPGHFMVTEQVRRRENREYVVLRESDDQIYSLELDDKTGFVYSSQRELHLWAGSSIAGIPFSFAEDVAFHLNFLLADEIVAGGGGTTSGAEEEESSPKEPEDSVNEEPEDPEKEKPERPEKPDDAGPKGNNGIGNGVDDQPPGAPPINDDEEAVNDGNASGGKGKGKK